MFARVATFEGVDLAGTESVFREAESRVRPIIEELTGWSGGMTLVDRTAGKVITINLFDNEEDIEAAEPAFDELPAKIGEEARSLIAGKRTTVERFEVVSERVLAR